MRIAVKCCERRADAIRLGGFHRPDREPMAADLLETVEITTGKSPTATIIWLHGLGADGHDFEPIVPELAPQDQLELRFVFPHAPMRPVTINAGFVMRAWYDIVSIDRAGPQDEKGVMESAAAVEALVARERKRGIAAERIVIAGFSQGGAIALHTGLRHAERLAGIIALSTWLPLASRLDAERDAANWGLPIFMAHGTLDPIVPEQLGRESAEHLAGLGYDVEWRSYQMPHAVCPEEIRAIQAWLLLRLEGQR